MPQSIFLQDRTGLGPSAKDVQVYCHDAIVQSHWLAPGASWGEIHYSCRDKILFNRGRGSGGGSWAGELEVLHWAEKTCMWPQTTNLS